MSDERAMTSTAGFSDMVLWPADSDYLDARQRGYDILMVAMGAPAAAHYDWRCGVDCRDLHSRVVSALNRLERKMGLER